MMIRVGIPFALVLSLSSFTGCSSGAAAPAVQEPAACSAAGLTVFGDASHTKPQCAFNVQTNAAAYAYMTNVAPSDYYVMEVESGTNQSCIYVSPPGKGHRCNLKASSGVQAPGGNVALTWPLTASLPLGSYAMAIYDLTAGQTIANVQVTLI